MTRSRSTGGSGWGLVRACPRCGRPAPDCRCPDGGPEPAAPGRPVARIRLERRRGKLVTVAAIDAVPADAWKPLLKELKGRLATGGTLRDGRIELQGDHRDQVREVLVGRGYQVKG